MEGHDIPAEQKVEKDLYNSRLVCKNSHQSYKPKPPYYWFNSKIKCRDYKIRHCCKCLYGCHPAEYQAGAYGYPIEMPQIFHIFDECAWKPFVSHEIPTEQTWDGEDRATAIKYNTSEQVMLKCYYYGGMLF